MHGGVGERAATALACNLTRLEHLQLHGCSIDLGSAIFLAAIAQLKQLRYLCLRDNFGLIEQGLLQLTRLSCLKHIDVDRNEEVTDQVLNRSWVAVRQQR
jgi:hypothetical protein